MVLSPNEDEGPDRVHERVALAGLEVEEALGIGHLSNERVLIGQTFEEPGDDERVQPENGHPVEVQGA